MVCLGKHRSVFLEPKRSWTLGNEGRRAIERLDFFNRYCVLYIPALYMCALCMKKFGFLLQAVQSTYRFLSQGLIWFYGHIET